MAKEIVFVNGDQLKVAHSVSNPNIRLEKPKLSTNVRLIDQLEFTISSDHPAAGFISELQTMVLVADNETREEIFEGLVLKRTGSSRNYQTEKRYIAEDCLAFLKFTKQKIAEYSGSPKGLLELIINRHNELSEAERQFDVGIVEIDTYRVYVGDGATDVNVTLAVGDKATIKPTAQYIWDDNGTRLNMANSVKGVAHTVATVGTSGVFAGKYRLRHPNAAWGISGWVQAEDIVEVYTTTGGSEAATFANPLSTVSHYPAGTQVRIKPNVTTYYGEAAGGNRITIPTNKNGLNYRTLTYQTRNYSLKYKRYSLVYDGWDIAWIDEGDLDFGNVTKPTEPIDRPRPDYIEKKRTVTAELRYEDTTLDAIKEHLLTPFGAEIEWEKIEGIRTLHIRNKIERQTTQRIEAEVNLISAQETFDPKNIVTAIIPIGRKAVEESE